MKFNKHLFLSLLLSYLIFIPVVFGCQFDTDCETGSKCIKPGGGLYGYCVGGLNPGNSNDRKPAYNPLDTTGRQGSTCQFDTDCGPGGQCLKGSSIYGTCF